jgi:predicted MFS family arabinose efflux permease
MPGAVLALGLAIAMAGGLVEGAFAGLFPLFGSARGLGAPQIAWLLSIFGIGGLLFQYPLGWLADHRGLRATAMLCTVGTALALAVLAWPPAMGSLALALFFLGGFLTAFLTLAMIAATDTGHDDPAATFSRITMTYTASSALGPLVGGAVMQTLGGSGFVAQAELPLIALAVYVVWGRRKRQPD